MLRRKGSDSPLAQLGTHPNEAVITAEHVNSRQNPTATEAQGPESERGVLRRKED